MTEDVKEFYARKAMEAMSDNNKYRQFVEEFERQGQILVYRGATAAVSAKFYSNPKDVKAYASKCTESGASLIVLGATIRAAKAGSQARLLSVLKRRAREMEAEK